MKTSTRFLNCILILAILFVADLTLSHAQNTWTQKADFGGTARFGAAGYSISSDGYIGIGNGGGPLYNDFWKYDTSTNSWIQKAGTVGSWVRVGFSIGSKAYIGTGYDGSYTNTFWEYDSATDTWAQKANFGGTSRQYAVGFSIGSKGYIGTGYDGLPNFKKDFWEYDPSTNVWTQKANFGGAARSNDVGFSIGSKGYIGTGNDANNFYNDFWEYDPSTNTWVQKADFGGTARQCAVGFFIGSKGYIGLGYDGSNYYNDFWEYDPTANTWTQKANLGGAPRTFAAGFSIGNKGYIGTGRDENSNPLGDFWEYAPDLPTPNSNFVSSATNVCEKLCINFTDQSINNPTSWQWNFPGGSPSSSTDENPTNICYNSSGSYDVTLISTNAVGSDTLTLVNYITVNATPPLPVITQFVYTLISSPAFSYQWQFNSADIPAATNQVYNALQTGYYTVIIGDTNGCINSAMVYVLIDGISDVVGDSNFSIFPNPSSDKILLAFSSSEKKQIQITNTLGQIVLATTINSQQEEINLRNFPRGIYLVMVKTDSQTIEKKFLKE